MKAVELHAAQEGGGRPIVLLHPVGLDGACWDWVAPALCSTHRVIRIDLRGHGQSPAAPLVGDVYAFAGDVARTLDRLRAGPAAIVGVSFGGMVATALAIARPDLVSALVASACPSAIPETARSTIASRGTDAERGGMAAVLDETLARWFSEPFLGSEAVEAVRQRLLADDPKGWSAAWQAIADLDLTARLAEIRAPALCLHAENDRATSLAAMQATADRIPGARLTLVEDAPHMLHIEKPRQFSDAVLAFLDAP